MEGCIVDDAEVLKYLGRIDYPSGTSNDARSTESETCKGCKMRCW